MGGSQSRIRIHCPLVFARANTGIQIAYEYAGGKSSPPPVAVDGPDAAETGASVEYVAEKHMSNIPYT